MKKFTSLLLAVVMVFTMALAAISVSAAPITAEVTAGKSYVMSINQVTAGAVIYFDGTMSGNYFAGNEDASKAVALTAEAVDGGFRFFFMDGSAKKYIDIYEYQAGKVGVQITETPSGVFVYDNTLGTYVVAVAGVNYYLGTYGTYKTFSKNDVKYISGDKAADVGVSQFPAVFTEAGSAPVTPPVDTTPSTTAPEVTDAPTAPAEPLLKDAVLADLVFKGADDTVKDTSYVERTNAAGWKATGARADAPAFTGATAAITLNGKTSAPGTLTSTVIEGGIAQLAFNYGFAFSDDQFSLTITVKKADGTVIKSDKLEKTGLTKEVAYDYILDVNTNEDVIIEIVNNCLTGTDKNKDRLAIWNLCWTKPAAAPETTAPAESGDTGDAGVFFAVAAVAVVMLAGTAVISKKREN